MKREGRQHGMVRTYMNLPSPYNPKSPSKIFNKLDSLPTAGLFNKVQPKPTNHSKFTGKCGKPRCVECHIHPCCKSRDKTKGASKMKSHDVVSSHKLFNWRVVDSKPGLSWVGFSASGMLEQMANEDDENVIEVDDGYGHENSQDETFDYDYDNINNQGGDDDDDDKTSFCDVGFLVVDQVDGEEGWCVVAEL